MVVKDGKYKFIGFVDLGEMYDVFEKLLGKYMFMKKNVNFFFLVMLNY